MAETKGEVFSLERWEAAYENAKNVGYYLVGNLSTEMVTFYYILKSDRTRGPYHLEYGSVLMLNFDEGSPPSGYYALVGRETELRPWKVKEDEMYTPWETDDVSALALDVKGGELEIIECASLEEWIERGRKVAGK